jgi:L-alanine-DL-glutamate epimerase-like enolase superfamily enzyme
MDMPPEGWKEECRQAVAAGYTSAKLKARPWFDLKAAVTAVQKVVPSGFHLDLDYNGTLGHSANAIPHLRAMEAFEEIAMIETPIPQNDVAGNKQIRQRTGKPVTMHYGNPPAMTTLKEDIADGFVLCAGATRLTRQAAVCDEANKPFWLQLVGTGITTAWAAHLGAVLPQAKWPAITCMNIWQSQLVTKNHEIRGGFYPVSDKAGLGITLDRSAIKRHKVNYDWVDPPRHLYEYSRKSGEVTRCLRQTESPSRLPEGRAADFRAGLSSECDRGRRECEVPEAVGARPERHRSRFSLETLIRRNRQNRPAPK